LKTEDERDSAELGGQNGGYGDAASIPLSTLPPGDYVLTVEARSRLGGEAAVRRQTEFTILNTARPAADAAPGGQGSAMRTIERGVQSQVDGARQVVARTEQEWTDLWRAHDYDRPAPAVDFGRDMVLGVFMGSRPTAGFAVEIVGTRVDDGTLVVDYRETRPMGSAVAAQVITSPFHLVAVPRETGEVRFERVD
jgi:PrcB C-terminal